MREEVTTAAEVFHQKVGIEDVRRWTKILTEYQSGKAIQDNRVVNAENWWRLRNTEEEAKAGFSDEGYRSKSAWLHHVLASKHADATKAYPEPTFLPRQEDDQAEARKLSDILPLILDQNGFPRLWSEHWWRKLKTGTGIYKTTWDPTKNGGLGDILVEDVLPLNVFWQPGLKDIQKSPYFFHAEMQNLDAVKSRYPAAAEMKGGSTFQLVTFEDNQSETDQVCVVDVYYHRDGLLHFAKFTGEVLLYATENDQELAERGLYDHGMYPFVFDPLFPMEGTPCGYGYVDVCQSPQTDIDVLDSAIVLNTLVGATPRYFTRGEPGNSGINEEEFLDLKKRIIHAPGGVDEQNLRPVEVPQLNGNYLNVRQGKIDELRQTSGNTEQATGTTTSGVTAASAIAALQEASGKLSQDAIDASYDAFADLVQLCVELIRQFYDLERSFRVTDAQGQQSFTKYSNSGLKPIPMTLPGIDGVLYRKPILDVEIKVQKENAYTSIATNEMAIQLYNMGIYDPANAQQAMMMLEMMDFRGREELMQRVSQAGALQDKYQMLVTYAATLARKYQDGAALQQLAAIAGIDAQTPAQGGSVDVEAAAGGYEGVGEEHPVVEKARERANEAAQPGGATV